jgi:hypothetical protein
MIHLEFQRLNDLDLLCAHLQVTPRQLWSFVAEPDKYYTPILITRPRRSPRTVYKIEPPLKRLHRTIAVALDPHVARLGTHVQGFRKRPIGKKRRGRIIGISSNAGRHRNANVVVTADIRAFFDCIELDRIRKLFLKLGTPSIQAATLLARLVTYKGQLAQGGRASPSISNLAVRDLDATLLRLAGTSTYSRYVDDLCFSGEVDTCPSEDEIRQGLALHGFELRCDSYKRQLKKSGQIVTGLSLFHEKPTLTRAKRRAIERALHYGAQHGLKCHLKHIRSTKSPEAEFARLSGMIRAVGGVDRSLYRRWCGQLKKVKL